MLLRLVRPQATLRAGARRIPPYPPGDDGEGVLSMKELASNHTERATVRGFAI
jgi:hypothetical protein